MGFILGIDKYNNEKYSEFGKAKLSSYCFFYSRKYIIDFIEKNKCIVKITYSPLRASQKLKKMMDTAVAVMELDERMIPLDVVLKQNVTMEMAAALGALSATTAIVSTNSQPDEIDFVSDHGIYSYEIYSVTEYSIAFEHIGTLNEKTKDLLLSKYNLIEQSFEEMCSKHKVSTSSGNKFVKETIDTQRSRPAVDEVTTHYNPIGKNLVILSGNGKPIKFDGIKVYGLGFMETPNPPLPWTPNPDNAAGVADQTVMPIQPHSFNMDKSYGLGSTVKDDVNRYRWKVSFISADGSESPLSAPSIAISWITHGGGAPATYNNKRQAVYLENIPVGPEGTIGRKLYRTKNLKEDDEEIYYYLDTIVNNFETNYVDYTKDTRLGALAPDDSASILFPAPSTRFSATFKKIRG